MDPPPRCSSRVTRRQGDSVTRQRRDPAAGKRLLASSRFQRRPARASSIRLPSGWSGFTAFSRGSLTGSLQPCSHRHCPSAQCP
ncbi:hypothetical protein E2562_009190 [Oryza meyeriana var. granulata]|uniref:Uncharacterized protein n=1 Tax=Oryza meyeriana var. granulata TaxID=110450 RepID=A0A6G1D153_9ORYZ|nr:hypothetical protein E2562_009190 [Oryza meyeriana var. granulata]